MGTRQNQIYSQLLAAITKLQNPESNQAQNFLTQEAMAGANFLKKGDFSQLPKGMFLDFKMPAEMVNAYKRAINVNQGGTFALAGGAGGDMGGRTNAQALQSKYLSDKFARDSAQNYQDNISNAAGNIRGALAQSAGATAQNQMGVIGALQGLYGSPALNKPGIGGQLLGMAGALGGGALSSLKSW